MKDTKLTKINLLSVAALAILFSLFLVSCSKSGEDEGSAEESENLVQAVRVENLSKSTMRKFIEINGNIRSEKSMSVYPVMSGKIASTKVHLGSQVKKGQIIAYVDPSVPGSRYSLNEITSPISGTVISIPLKEGTRVDTETAVVTIGDLSKLQIISYIPERYVSFLKEGLDGDVSLEAYPGEKLKAKVTEVSPVLDEATRTKEVILKFSSDDERVNAGMFADVKLYLKDFENVFAVPTSCIIEKDGGKYIYIIENEKSSEENSTVRLVQIKPGEEIEDRTIIEFSAGEAADGSKVVVQGFETLQDGSAVHIAD